MAKIFRAVFDEMLPKEDLVELEGRERLPSPEELWEKIILKSPVKEKGPEVRLHYIYEAVKRIRYSIIISIYIVTVAIKQEKTHSKVGKNIAP